MENNYNEIEYGERMGFSEMFEWGEESLINQTKSDKSKNNIVYHCKLVQFNDKYPNTVIRARTTKNIVGISTINSCITASNPNIWPYAYVINEYGDLYLQNKDIGEGKKTYDPINEMSIMQTYKKQVIVPLKNPEYDLNKLYVKRNFRNEWCNVVILGKAIIEDNGKCKPGKYCTLYKGNDENKYGTVIPAKKNDDFKLYVLQRLSDNTIIVFFTPQIY